MKGAESILFFLAMGLFVIGTHQALIYSISHAYGIFALSLALLFTHAYLKGRRRLREQEEAEKQRKGKKKKKSKSK